MDECGLAPSWFHSSICVPEPKLCAARWPLSLLRQIRLEKSSFFLIKKIIQSKEHSSLGDSDENCENAERVKERVGGRLTLGHVRLTLSRPPGQGWWHHKRGKIRWKVTSLETAKQICKKTIQPSWHLNATPMNLNKQQQMWHQRRTHIFLGKITFI